ncbi:MAG: hypothetical protein LQ351_001003 [Letrouitia transgressa]|nr:MAG: hypothetical protein LQ351_001003 [Letrouitia transgressa]
MPSPPPPGIYVPVPTFFAPSTSLAPPLDLSSQAKHAVHLAKCGIRGLVLLGSTGEAIMITNTERKGLIGHMRQELKNAGYPDFPLIAGTYTQGIEDTITQLDEAKTAGAQWGLVLAPGYFAPTLSQQGIVDWYTAIADHSPLPILIYHYPAVSNNITLHASTFAHLSAHPNIVGAKLSHGDLSLHAQLGSSPNPALSSSSFATFTGLGQQLLPVLTVGCAGAIDGLAAFFPRTVVKLYNLVKEGDLLEAKRIQEVVARGEGLVVAGGVVGVKEGVRRMLGMDSETRLPLKKGLSDEEWAKWDGVMGELQALEDQR